jgi:hypothetical protein
MAVPATITGTGASEVDLIPCPLFSMSDISVFRYDAPPIQMAHVKSGS